MPVQITLWTPKKIKGLYLQMLCERVNTEFFLQENPQIGVLCKGKKILSAREVVHKSNSSNQSWALGFLKVTTISLFC